MPNAEKFHSFINDTSLHQRLMVELVQKECGSNMSRILEMIEIMTNEPSFFSLLSKFIDRNGWSEVEFYTKAHISRAVFSNVRDQGHRPQKNTVVKSIIGLALDFTDSSALLEKAGYSFVWTDKTDLTVIFCIMNKIYDPIEVDDLLNKAGQNVLFSVE